MSQVSALQSLDLILEDVSAEINLSINGLDQYARNQDSVKPLKKSLAHLNKLKGVFTLLEMQGAQRLVVDAMALIKNLPKKKEETRQRLLEIVSTALARLMRYTEHVNQKPYDLPQLLLPAINSIRGSINAPQLSESAFFNGQINKPRANCKMALITSEESAERSRHFRQMYQIGFIEVIRQTNIIGGLKMMQRAMQQLDSECPRPNSPNLWWLAEVMLDGFIEETLKLTKSRLKLFSRLDLQIRQVENKPSHILQENRAETRLLANDMLYLSMISGASTERVANLLKHFDLVASPISDALLHEESSAMRGPSERDYHSIAETLVDEINSISDALKNSRENQFEPLDLQQTLKQMSNLHSLLKILQVDDHTVRLSVAIDLLRNAISEKKLLSEKDTNILQLVLDAIHKVINQSDLEKYSGKSSLRRATLSKLHLDICERTYQQVQLLMKEFALFTQQNRKQTLLKNIHGHLDAIRTGMQQLKSKQATTIVDGCIVFFDYHLIKNPHSTSELAINLFADIIGSLEFYLDTLKFTATPSPKILEFAEDSLLQLNREIKNAKHSGNTE